MFVKRHFTLRDYVGSISPAVCRTYQRKSTNSEVRRSEPDERRRLNASRAAAGS